jgi:hypothetical protein
MGCSGVGVGVGVGVSVGIGVGLGVSVGAGNGVAVAEGEGGASGVSVSVGAGRAVGGGVFRAAPHPASAINARAIRQSKPTGDGRLDARCDDRDKSSFLQWGSCVSLPPFDDQTGILPGSARVVNEGLPRMLEIHDGLFRLARASYLCGRPVYGLTDKDGSAITEVIAGFTRCRCSHALARARRGDSAVLHAALRTGTARGGTKKPHGLRRSRAVSVLARRVAPSI